MTGSTKKTTFKTVLMWFGIAVGAAFTILPVVLVARGTRAANAKREEGRPILAKGKAELERIEALDRVRSKKLEAARTMKPGSQPCLEVPAVLDPPVKRGADLRGQLWDTYIRELTSSDSPFELRGSVSMVGLTQGNGGPRVRVLRSAVSTLESFLSQGSVRDDLPKLPLAKDWQRDVTIWVDQVQNPYVRPGTREFEGGQASGTAVLFDYDRGDVVCVGHFEATNSDTFVATFRKEYGREFTSDVHRDLRGRAIVAGIYSLRAVDQSPRVP